MSGETSSSIINFLLLLLHGGSHESQYLFIPDSVKRLVLELKTKIVITGLFSAQGLPGKLIFVSKKW